MSYRIAIPSGESDFLGQSAGHLFIGVDGGGTGCRARIRDAEGRPLGEGRGGPANARLGAAAFEEILKACRQAADGAGLAAADLGRMHAGLGLAGTAQAADRDFILAQRHPFAAVAVDTDAYAAWLGAHQGRDGAILIVGTGSCGLAVVEGRRFNVGGWGAEISDEGSGMAIGRAAIRRSLWALEGMGPMTPLAEAVLAAFDREPEKIVSWADAAKPADYARFAPVVFEHAGRGDALAATLLREAADDIGRMIQRLLALGAPKLALVGGLAEPIAAWLPPALRGCLVKPLADAADGAILMARRALAVEPGEVRR
jgi:glucosamine kinase